MKKKILLFCAAVVFCNASLTPDQEDWKAYKKEHRKHYDCLEDDKRHFRIFVDQKSKIIEHNQKFEDGIETFRMGLNQFSDMDNEDVSKVMPPVNEPDE